MSKLSHWLRTLRARPEPQLPGPEPLTPYDDLLEVPRYTEQTIKLFDEDFRLNDGASFYSSYREIFEQEIYRFEAVTQQPKILDLGANCGASVVYFKSLYPESQIVALEPDPQQFDLLKWNVERRGLSGVRLKQQAVSSSRGEATFHREGADAGRLHPLDGARASFSVPTIPIDELINEPIDLLKIDIEGAETDALAACTKLDLVDQLFVEHHSFVDSPATLHHLLSLLDQAGYRYYLQTQFCSPRPLVESTSHLGMDLQMNVFAHRKPAATAYRAA